MINSKKLYLIRNKLKMCMKQLEFVVEQYVKRNKIFMILPENCPIHISFCNAAKRTSFNEKHL